MPAVPSCGQAAILQKHLGSENHRMFVQEKTFITARVTHKMPAGWVGLILRWWVVSAMRSIGEKNNCI